MKNLILALVLVFTINTFGQTTPAQQTKPKSSKSKSTKQKSKTQKPGDKVVNKALYTPEEKEMTRQNFIKEIDSIGMDPEVKTEYTKIVKKHWSRIAEANKDKNLTKDQATEYVNMVIKDQNSEIQRMLTADQYKKHELIMNRYQNSVLYRIEQH